MVSPQLTNECVLHFASEPSFIPKYRQPEWKTMLSCDHRNIWSCVFICSISKQLLLLHYAQVRVYLLSHIAYSPVLHLIPFPKTFCFYSLLAGVLISYFMSVDILFPLNTNHKRSCGSEWQLSLTWSGKNEWSMNYDCNDDDDETLTPHTGMFGSLVVAFGFLAALTAAWCLSISSVYILRRDATSSRRLPTNWFFSSIILWKEVSSSC